MTHSLAVRAAIALALLVGYYVLALCVAVSRISLIWLEIAVLDIVEFRVTILAVVGHALSSTRSMRRRAGESCRRYTQMSCLLCSFAYPSCLLHPHMYRTATRRGPICISSRAPSRSVTPRQLRMCTGQSGRRRCKECSPLAAASVITTVWGNCERDGSSASSAAHTACSSA